MADFPAINASPLIFLTRAGLLDLLRLAAPEIIVPAPVAEEIQRRGSSDPAAQAIASLDWLANTGCRRGVELQNGAH